MNKSVGKITLAVYVFLSGILLLSLMHGNSGWAVDVVPVEVFNAEGDVCASVKIEISQELTLERQAFEARMRINNSLSTITMENISIEVYFTDNEGNPVLASSNPDDTSASFFIRVDHMQNISNITGSGTVEPSTTVDIFWLIIPAVGAAKDDPAGSIYYVGATLSYTMSGEDNAISVNPDYIIVKPMPDLSLDYFLTRNVLGDDAFTSEIEPSVPFTLGVRVKNNGYGYARNLKIDSAQPKIFENEQGLLVDFKIEGCLVNDVNATKSLLADFGDIAPGTSEVARWVMTCSLSGWFENFTAQFSHADELGGQMTSLISEIHAHDLVRDVLVDLPGRDTVRDFLAFDNDEVYRVYESEGMDFDVSDVSPASHLTDRQVNGSEIRYKLIIDEPLPSGFVYLKLTDQEQGAYTVSQVRRSDGKIIKDRNAWFSKKRDDQTQAREWDYYFNLFDVNTTGSYDIIIIIIDENHPPQLDPVYDRIVRQTESVSFTVSATDPDGDALTLTSSQLPRKASFTDNNDNTGTFIWPTEEGQTGEYPIRFTVSDGVYEDSKSCVISVTEEGVTVIAYLDDYYSGTEGNAIMFNASGSSSGDSIVYQWDFENDGIYDLVIPSSAGTTAQHTWNDDFTGFVRLTVTDIDNSVSATVYAAVEIFNDPPAFTSSLPFDNLTSVEYEDVYLNDLTFEDDGLDDVHIFTVIWGDGNSDDYALTRPSRDIQGSIISHKYTQTGDYDVYGRIADDDGGYETRLLFSVSVGLKPIDIIEVYVEKHNDNLIGIDFNDQVRITFTCVPGKTYDLYYSDNDASLNDSRINLLSNWIFAGSLVAGSEEESFFDSGSVSQQGIPDRAHPYSATIRYYRVVQNDPIDANPLDTVWWGAPSIGYICNVKLWEGRNFAAKAGNGDSLIDILDCRFLPGGLNQTSATKINYWDFDGLPKAAYVEKYMQQETGLYANRWKDMGAASVLQDNDTLADGAGVLLLLPLVNPLPCTMPMAGIIENDDEIQIPIPAAVYTLCTWPYTVETSLDNSGLLEAGFRSGMASHMADQIFFFNPQTQAYDLAVFHCKVLTFINEWRYHDQTPCTRKLKPGESFLIKMLPGADINWNIHKPYHPDKYFRQ